MSTVLALLFGLALAAGVYYLVRKANRDKPTNDSGGGQLPPGRRNDVER